MAEPTKREAEDQPPRQDARPPGMLTSDIPEEWRAGRFVTLTVGGDVDLSETHPTEANPEARG